MKKIWNYDASLPGVDRAYFTPSVAIRAVAIVHARANDEVEARREKWLKKNKIGKFWSRNNGRITNIEVSSMSLCSKGWKLDHRIFVRPGKPERFQLKIDHRTPEGRGLMKLFDSFVEKDMMNFNAILNGPMINQGPSRGGGGALCMAFCSYHILRGNDEPITEKTPVIITVPFSVNREVWTPPGCTRMKMSEYWKAVETVFEPLCAKLNKKFRGGKRPKDGVTVRQMDEDLFG